jgi:hypothetical protein
MSLGSIEAPGGSLVRIEETGWYLLLEEVSGIVIRMQDKCFPSEK